MTTTSPGLGCSQGPAMRGMATIIMTATLPCTYDNHTTKKVDLNEATSHSGPGMVYFWFISF